jgi:putative MATE family efflux protein
LARTLKKENIERILYQPSILKGIVILSIPVFLNNLLKSIHDMVDAIFIARMPAESQSTLDAALTALNIHWPIYFFFLALGAGLSVATVAMISQYVGANRRDLAKSYASKLFLVAFLIGLLVMGIFFVTSDVILGYNLFAYLMGARDEALVFAGSYFRIRSYEFVFIFLFMVYQAIRQSTGETLRPVLMNAFGIVINIILTYVFVARMQLGIDGAAYATLIAQASVMPLVFIDLFFSKKHLTITFKEMRLEGETLEQIQRFALPAAISQAISSLGFVVIQAMILSYGTFVSAGFSVGNRISSILLHPVLAVTTILAAYVGLNIGHNQPERARAAYKVARNLSFLMMVVGIAIIIPIRGSIIYLILGTDQSDSYRVAYQYVVWVLCTQPFMALFQSYISLFNGSGKSQLSMRMALLRLWGVRIPLVLIFMYFYPPDDYSGVWYAMFISNIVILFYGHFLKRQIAYDVQVKLS